MKKYIVAGLTVTRYDNLNYLTFNKGCKTVGGICVELALWRQNYAQKRNAGSVILLASATLGAGIKTLLASVTLASRVSALE